MLQLGRYNHLKVIDKKYNSFILDFGIKMLADKNNAEEINIGDELDVFVYNDTEKGLVATTTPPFAQVGELALLEVVDENKMGVFLDIGLEKDVLLLKNKMEYNLEIGDEVLVAIRLDNKKRLSATMFISDYLEIKKESKIGDMEKGIVYRVNPEMGIFIAIDGRYHGFIHKNKLIGNFQGGEDIEARVTNIRPDGKIEMSLKEAAHIAVDSDSDLIYNYMLKKNGRLDVNDKSDPEIIKKKFGLSKKAFKRAVGKLYKEQKIIKVEDNFIINKRPN